MRGKAMKILALILTVTLTLSSFHVSARADGGKYVSDVYFAYGKTEEEAVKWLTDNGWEPIKGSNDFNAGKNSYFDDSLAVAMGIKRTDNAEEAITDMAVMNMKGGYSFPDYEELLEQKKTEIDEFISTFLPILAEYRANYNGEGSEAGRMRAEMAFEILNKFYDGGKDEEYAKNDTGLPIGELLLTPTIQEGNENGGDLQQILLEGSGAVVVLIEQMLTLGADANPDTWLERLSSLSGDGLLENLGQYIPDAAGQSISPSVAEQYLNQYFGDAAMVLADQWSLINEDLQWYASYCTANDLWQKDGETVEDRQNRVDACFADLEKNDPEAFEADQLNFIEDNYLYTLVYNVQYAGEWGETLGDFFNPADGTRYDDPEYFLPFAAALSEGQRAAASLVSLRNLLFMGTADKEGMEIAGGNISSVVANGEPVSIYFGINRGIFRGGVALTSAAEMAQAMGNGHVYDLLYGNNKTYTIVSYAAATSGLISVIVGTIMAVKGHGSDGGNATLFQKYVEAVDEAAVAAKNKSTNAAALSQSEKTAYENWQKTVHTRTTGVGYLGRGLLAIGAVLLIGAAVYNGYRFYEYYQKTFTPIPMMIVDEADIVSYVRDEAGNSQRTVTFDQYAYYDVAKCNRQAVGNTGNDWQDGVESYAEWGCGDAVDLNGDFGQEWLSLYTVKNLDKGNPILADSLTLQYGSSDLPKGCTQKLHFFTMTNAVDLGDMAYSFNNNKNGVYFFWDSDAKAAAGTTASAFSGGQMALAAAGGVVLGLLIAFLISLSRKKKRTVQAA